MMKRKIKFIVTFLLLLGVAVMGAYAGDGGESVPEGTWELLNRSIEGEGPFGFNTWSVLLGFFSLWMAGIGLMCYRLEKIPKIKAIRKAE